MTTRVYIVEEHDICRLALKLTLARLPEIKIVGEAGDCEDLINDIVKTRPDVVHLDITHPRCDGLFIAQQIKKHLPATKIVASSGYPVDESEVCTSFSAGIDGFALKGLPAEQLKAEFETVLKGSNWLDPEIVPSISQNALMSITGTPALVA